MEFFGARVPRGLSLYNYRLYDVLIKVKPGLKSFSELIDDTGIKDTGYRYPARLSLLLRINTDLKRIELIDLAKRPEKPILRYRILPEGEAYFNLLIEAISHFKGMYETDEITHGIVEKASVLADKFVGRKSDELRKYELTLQTPRIR